MARRRLFTEKYKVKTVKEFQVSGLTASEFCKQRGMADTTFSLWNKRLGHLPTIQSPAKTVLRQNHKSAPGIDFIPVTLVETKPISSTPTGLVQLVGLGSVAVEIVLPSGTLIRLASNCPPSFLTSALAAMAVQ